MGYILTIDQYLENIKNEKNREILKKLLEWVKKNFDLDLEIKYNQPMFLKNKTFILAISNATHHMSIAPELETMNEFRNEIILAGYEPTQQLFKIRYNDEINYNLLTKIIEFNIETKKNFQKFWR